MFTDISQQITMQIQSQSDTGITIDKADGGTGVNQTCKNRQAEVQDVNDRMLKSIDTITLIDRL